MNAITHAEVCKALEQEVISYGSLRKAAAGFRVSPQYLSAVLAGKKSIGPKLLRPLKLRKHTIVAYLPVVRRG